jgi:hypothetical protein
LTGSFDRAVVAYRDGRPSAALVIDFKTDAVPDDATCAARILHHRPQMEAYRRALAALTGLAPEDVRCRLLFLAADRIEDL